MHEWPVAGPIRGVIFDVHSTLLDQGTPQDWLDNALAVTPQDLDEGQRKAILAFLDRIWEGARVSDPESTRDLSFADHHRVFHELIDAGPGIDRPLADALYEVLLETWHAYDDTLPTLRALRERGLGICLLSNAGLSISHVLDREGISPLVDHVVLSFEVGAVKPDERIFRTALGQLGLSAADVLMVGDNANDDGGATHLGIRTLILPRTAGGVHGLSAVVGLVDAVNATFA